MEENKVHNFIKGVLENLPADWMSLTTHRLDIYNEELAKVQFLEQFENLFSKNDFSKETLSALPTAYDYIRLGHPLSCVLEWAIAKSANLPTSNVISFSSSTIALLAILRKNRFENKKTQVNYIGNLPSMFDASVVKEIYEYSFDLNKVEHVDEVGSFDGSTIFISQSDDFKQSLLNSNVDFNISTYSNLGSVVSIDEGQDESYVPAIQHVRRRETIAMTPANCLAALKALVDQSSVSASSNQDDKTNKEQVLDLIKEVTGINTKPLVGSSGLSIQYAILMGLVHHAKVNHPEKGIRIVVPTNCYGGTNDQARRVAKCIDNVEIVDLHVDAGSDMVESINTVLSKIAKEDAVPYIIAEIPTNPRVEVPDLEQLREALSATRKTSDGQTAVDPVFILDQTFCPNVQFLGEGKMLSSIRTISFSSGSKFPSGGKCTAGYCVGNPKASNLMEFVEKHLLLCDNEATDFQYAILAEQMPSILDRISGAYKNTRAFVSYIQGVLPAAKINFVSEELAEHGFTPSVFSLDLPTKGATDEERETYKRALNLKLINLMITEIPNESKYCVSYGQLKGCYWTIPATSTQGTTNEGDKDYIVRAALSANMDLEKHKSVFAQFVDGLES